ncbi:hypothetical protein ACVWWN_008337 [Mycobacterium sp. URHB0021]
MTELTIDVSHHVSRRAARWTTEPVSAAEAMEF